MFMGGKLYAPIPWDGFKGIGITNEHRNEPIIEELRNHQDIKSILDIGSHWGSICYDLEKEGYDVTAVERNVAHYTCLVYLKN